MLSLIGWASVPCSRALGLWTQKPQTIKHCNLSIITEPVDTIHTSATRKTGLDHYAEERVALGF